jgi:hypothetical protein
MANKQLCLSNNRLFNNSNIAAPGGTAELYLSGGLTAAEFLAGDGSTLGHVITANGLGQLPNAYQNETTAFRLILKDRNGAELDGGDIDPFYFGLAGPDASLLQPFADSCSASATAAATSETNAANSATAASTSATSAASSATNSANSATAAANSATDAATAESGAQAAEAGTIAALSGTSLSNATLNAATRTLLAALDHTLGLPAVLTEAGREGIFTFNSSDLSAKVTADTKQGIYIAPSSDTTGASGAWIRQVYGVVDPAWWGVVYGNATQATANSDAIDAMLATLEARATVIASGSRAFERIELRTLGKKLWIARTIVPRGTVHITSTGGAGGAFWTNAQIACNGDFTALQIQRGDTTGDSGGSVVLSDPYGAGNSIISNLSFFGYFGTSGVESEAHGINLRNRATVINCSFESFAGDAIHGYAAMGSGTINGNDNGCYISYNRIENCRDGIVFSGGDANANTIHGNDVFACRRWGISMAQFLDNYVSGNQVAGCGGTGPLYFSSTSYSGNVYDVIDGQATWCRTNAPSGTTTSNQGWHYRVAGAATATVPAWTTGQTYWRAGGSYYCPNNTGTTVFIGNYAEGGQAMAQIQAPNLVIGGSLSLTSSFFGTGIQVTGNTGGQLQTSAVLSKGTMKSQGKMGYQSGAGVGNSVTQLTSKTTGVTAGNVYCGQIVTAATVLAAGATASFLVTSGNVIATDIIDLSIAGVGAASGSAYTARVTKVVANQFEITLKNDSAGSLSDAVTINWAVRAGTIN